MVYVHTKLIIVDDSEMIIGSQNINDRSLLGNRDSEIGILIHNDPNQVPTTFNGVAATASGFVQDFRLRLWKEHLNIFHKNLSLYKVSGGWCATDDDRMCQATRYTGSCFSRRPKRIQKF